jgi:hypothetical protein
MGLRLGRPIDRPRRRPPGKMRAAEGGAFQLLSTSPPSPPSPPLPRRTLAPSPSPPFALALPHSLSLTPPLPLPLPLPPSLICSAMLQWFLNLQLCEYCLDGSACRISLAVMSLGDVGVPNTDTCFAHDWVWCDCRDFPESIYFSSSAQTTDSNLLC